MAHIELTEDEYKAGLQQIVQLHADHYAKVLVTNTEGCLKVQIVEFLLDEAGYTPASFLLGWIEGDFDA